MRVSVVTSVFNGEHYIQKAIDSILMQTEKDFEYIIVNDGSTDGTKEILNQITDSRVKIIEQKENHGASKSLHHAIENSSSNWIAIQDADDISLPLRLERQVMYLENQKDIGLAGSYIQCITNPNQRNLRRIALETERFFNSARSIHEIQNSIFYGSRFCHGTFMFSKKIYQQIGGYSQKYKIAYDYDLLQRFNSVSKIRKIPEILYKYRLSHSSLSKQNLLKTNAESMEISIQAIINVNNYLLNQKDYLIISSPMACQFFKEQISPKFDKKFDFCTPNLFNLNHIKSYNVIIFDHQESSKLIKKLISNEFVLNKDYFWVWCILT